MKTALTVLGIVLAVLVGALVFGYLKRPPSDNPCYAHYNHVEQEAYRSLSSIYQSRIASLKRKPSGEPACEVQQGLLRDMAQLPRERRDEYLARFFNEHRE
jgi:hypothetical protein